MDNAILSIKNLRVVFSDDGFVALDGVSLDIGKNEFVTLLGPSGCGKTTLLRCIGGFETPTSGEILYKGENIIPLPPYKRAINTVFQRYALFPHLNVAQNVAFGPDLRGQDKHKTAQEVSRMLEMVGLKGYEKRRIAQLSGGQQQRVAIARALINKPSVLLLDEPLAALDLKLRREMQLELKRIQRESGITFVFVTHDQEEALTMSGATPSLPTLSAKATSWREPWCATDWCASSAAILSVWTAASARTRRWISCCARRM